MYDNQSAFNDDARRCTYADDSLTNPTKLNAAFRIYQKARRGTLLSADNTDAEALNFGITIVGRLAQKGSTGEWGPSNETFPSIDGLMQENLRTLNEESGAGAILDTQKWSLLANDAWLLGGLHAKTEFHFASPLIKENLWDQANNRPTVTARELMGITKFGYQLLRPRPNLEVVAVCRDVLKATGATLPTYNQALRNLTEKDIQQLYDSLPAEVKGKPFSPLATPSEAASQHEAITSEFFRTYAVRVLSANQRVVLKERSLDGLEATELYDETDAIKQVADRFKSSAQSARAALKTQLLSDLGASSKGAVDAFVSEQIGASRMSAKKILIWVRQIPGPNSETRNLPYTALLQLLEIARGQQLIPVLLGDTFSFDDARRGAVITDRIGGDWIDLRRHYDHAVFKTPDQLYRQLYFFQCLFEATGAIGIMGVKSGVLNGPALLGMPTLALESYRDHKTETHAWVHPTIPHYHLWPTEKLLNPARQPVPHPTITGLQVSLDTSHLTDTETQAVKLLLQAFQQLKQSPNATTITSFASLAQLLQEQVARLGTQLKPELSSEPLKNQFK